jgi:shikimate dehydrogenase
MSISGKARVLGVFGHPIGHSLSPAMHNAAIEALGLDYVYVPFDVAPQDLEKAVEGVRALGIAGVNVTIPHKEAVMAFLDEIDQDALEIGSVNTIANRGGRLIGSSTDGPAFIRSLVETGYEPKGSKAVLWGGGGAGRAVAFALVKSGAEVVVFDEAPGKAEKLAQDVRGAMKADVARGESEFERAVDHLREANLLVNCTPVGMYPNVDRMPVSEDLLRADMTVYDVVYNPMRTRLLQAAEKKGARAVSGMKMFVYQGAISFTTWTGIEPPTDNMEAVVVEQFRV